MAIKVKKRLEKAAGYLFLWAGVLLFLNLLMAAGLFLFPKEKLTPQILRTGQYLNEKEEMFYYPEEGRYDRIIDDYADSILFNILYQMDRKDPVGSILGTPYYKGDEATPLEALINAAFEEKKANVLYDRYWHGMMLYLRPLFAVTDIRGIRIFSGVLLSVLGLLLTVRLLKRGCGAPALLLIAAAALVAADMAARCMEYLSMFLVTLLISHLLLFFLDRHRERIAPLFLVSGLLCAYFDFLTTETLAFVIPFVLYFYDSLKKGRLEGMKREWLRFTGLGLLWGTGYVATCLSKWLLSSAYYQVDRFRAALEQAAYRADGAAAAGHQLLLAFYRNVSCVGGLYRIKSLTGQLLVLLLLLLLAFCFVFLFRKGKGSCWPAGLLLAAGFLPLLRIGILNNHSFMHFFFTYRALAGTIVAWGAALTALTDRELLGSVMYGKRRRKSLRG